MRIFSILFYLFNYKRYIWTLDILDDHNGWVNEAGHPKMGFNLNPLFTSKQTEYRFLNNETWEKN